MGPQRGGREVHCVWVCRSPHGVGLYRGPDRLGIHWNQERMRRMHEPVVVWEFTLTATLVTGRWARAATPSLGMGGLSSLQHHARVCEAPRPPTFVEMPLWGGVFAGCRTALLNEAGGASQWRVM